MDTEKEKIIALLIDGENLHNHYDELIERLKEYGHISIARVYGDFTVQNVINDTRKDVLLTLGITPVQHYAYSKGKNSTDSKIIIDAMDILYKRNMNSICLATNDSDFTTLATRFKEENYFVIGASEQNKIPKALKTVCDKYIILGEVRPETKNDQSDLLTKKQLIQFVSSFITTNQESDGFVDFAWLVNEINKKFNEFDPRNFGSKSNKTSSFFKSLPEFELKQDGLVYYIKNKKSTKYDLVKK
ncbi:MAG: NYN domain-containing protein [Acholeplasmatales bacterium]|jgi:uncharacterized protein (TIGR00288 family)|nr:NYN domain-containing protein [Acholeplasmatales bacterium]